MILSGSITAGAFAAACLFGFCRRRPAALIAAAAFLFSLAGEWFLGHRGSGGERYFLYGIGCYFLAHAGFIAFAWCYGRMNIYVLGAVLPPYLLYGLFFLAPRIGDGLLAAAVCGYTFISVVSLAMAAGLKWPLPPRAAYFGGILLILLSDTVISLKEFLNCHRFDSLIMPTYMGAHVLLGAALLWMTFCPVAVLRKE